MYDFIKGTIVSTHTNYLVLNNNDIGYILYMPLNDLAKFSDMINKQVTIYTHYIHKEDSVTLYGFSDTLTRDGFKVLIKVDGVGPKTALAMLSKYSYETIGNAIEEESVDALKKIPGIGDKTARKMILDLKGTLVNRENSLSSADNDLIEAMVSMGYNKNDVMKIYTKGKPFSGKFSDDIKKLLKLMV